MYNKGEAALQMNYINHAHFTLSLALSLSLSLSLWPHCAAFFCRHRRWLHSFAKDSLHIAVACAFAVAALLTCSCTCICICILIRIFTYSRILSRLFFVVLPSRFFALFASSSPRRVRYIAVGPLPVARICCCSCCCCSCCCCYCCCLCLLCVLSFCKVRCTFAIAACGRCVFQHW